MTWLRERRLDPYEDAPQFRAALIRARIPDRYWSAQPEAVKGDPRWLGTALAQPEMWAGKGLGFYIHGPFNTGKSAVAAILLSEFVRRCVSVMWLAVREVPQVRFREGSIAAALDERLATTDVLVLDDVGAERFKLDGPAGGALEETVRIMYERNRPVIYTSNKSWETLSSTYALAPALVSIIQRVSIPVALTQSWPGSPDVGGVR